MAPGREYGSWLTISRTGRVGILTNVLVPRPDPNGLARGKLVTDFASSSFSPEDYFDTLALDQFNEFNLSAIDLLTKDAVWISSKDGRNTALSEDERYVMSNARQLNSKWQKAQKIKLKFDAVDLDRPKDEIIEEMLTLLQDSESCGECALIAEQSEGFVEKAIGMERYNSIKITGDERYGTRTHSVVIVDEKNQCTFVELDRKANGQWDRRCQEFKLDATAS